MSLCTIIVNTELHPVPNTHEVIFLSDTHIKDIELALERNEFVFHYQPKDFIPEAERSGLIKNISIKMFSKLIDDLVIIQSIKKIW